MAQLRIERVNALPATLVASTMYIVKSTDQAQAELVFVGTNVADVRHIINKTDVASMIAAAVGDLQNIIIVADIPARDALNPTRNELVLVLDATGDVSVAAGAALYIYNLATTTWVKVAEYESMDVTLEWSNIAGRPSSSPAAIDDAVNKAHSHANKTVLDDLGDTSGSLTYKGVEVGNFLAVAEW